MSSLGHLLKNKSSHWFRDQTTSGGTVHGHRIYWDAQTSLKEVNSLNSCIFTEEIHSKFSLFLLLH